MDTSPRSALLGVVAAGVAGGLYYLFGMHGYETLKGALSAGLEIAIYSPSRPTAKTFFVGEKLRFKLENSTSPKVFWLFEEQKVIPGTVEVEFAFLQDRSAPKGSKQLGRVDAFVRRGEAFASVSKTVDLDSLPIRSTVAQTDSQLTLFAPTKLANGWAIERVGLSSYDGAKFMLAAELKHQASPNPEMSEWTSTGKLPVTREIVQNADGEWVERVVSDRATKLFQYTVRAPDGNSQVELVKAIKPDSQ